MAIAGLGLAAIATITGCDKVALTSKDSGPTTAKVVKQDLTGYAFFEGKVVAPPGSTATVVSPYDVALGEVPVTQGKWVARGATIATMQLPDLKASVDQAELNLKSAESSYAAAKAQHDAPIREAERALADARAAERKAREDVQMGISADLVAATEMRKQAEAAVTQAKASMNAQLLPEKQAVDIAAEYLKDARAGARMANIKAPIAGTITMLEAKAGLVVEAKQPLATIVDLGAIRIQGTLPATLSDRVEKGTKILIALEGQNSDPFFGEVKEKSILPPDSGQESAGYLVVIDFNNEKGWVQPVSTIKRLGVETGKVENAMVVPVGAVETNGGKATVQVQKGSEWVATPVETGLSDGALIEIKSGLSEGDVVKLQ